MIPDTIKNTQLWTRSLGATTEDALSAHKEKLRVALDGMRDNVGYIVSDIHRDVLGLTVHDVTHLDALWQTADEIAGPEFKLNPAEAFVFGASVLLHDAAMAVAAFPGGMSELEATVEWKDAAAAVGESLASDLNSAEHNRVLFNVLRLLHARQAEDLITTHYSRPGRDEKLMLLTDPTLRDAFGSTIGKIAHSHHWNAGDLSGRLNTTSGSAPGFPPDWTVNEVKVACLLRCADAAHIDSRRAPTMLYALSKPTGYSEKHWSFQNKLNQVTRSGDKVVFTSGQPFGLSDSTSWWLCYDTIKMIDSEIKQCNAILAEVSEPFSARSVLGVESAHLLSKQIKIQGWTPIDAEVQVSDPIQLARTLGGQNLYGRGVVAPIRELLQNAVDAVRARRLQEDRGPEWGRVRLTIERDSQRSCWLHVDDSGVGMSERVLTGPLIDFGKSLWSSGMMQEEFPGLLSRHIRPIGKFGIGFFSVFLLGDCVKVVSRRFNAGADSARVLQFDELARRPLLRPNNNDELPLDFSTRISIKLNKDNEKIFIGSDDRAQHIFNTVIRMVSAVDVNIDYIDNINGLSHSHSFNWIESPAEDFLSELLGGEGDAQRLISAHKDLVTLISDKDGVCYGRAALVVTAQGGRSMSGVSVGGFLSSGVGHLDSGESFMPSLSLDWRSHHRFIGVLAGETNDVSRRTSTSTVPPYALANWATTQAAKLDLSKFTPVQSVRLCHDVISFGGDAGALPFGFLGGQFQPLKSFIEVAQRYDKLILLMSHSDYKNRFSLVGISQLTTNLFSVPLEPFVASIHAGEEYLNESVFDDDRRNEIFNDRDYLTDQELKSLFSDKLVMLSDIFNEIWGELPRAKIDTFPIYSSDLLEPLAGRWAMILTKP